MSNEFLHPYDEEELREATKNHDLTLYSYIDSLLKELDHLRSISKIDGEVYNLGRLEGRADIVVLIRKIIDPNDENHFNLDGLIKKLENDFEIKNTKK